MVFERSIFKLCFVLASAFFFLTASKFAVGSQYPLNFTNADGSITQINAKPKRILSTAVTVTGTLLAMDAPVIASAQTATASFFDQWHKEAKAKNVGGEILCKVF